jgi:Rrf2 family protein
MGQKVAFMRLSTRGDYAVLLMLEVARHENGASPVALSRVAHRTGLSRAYLEQLAIPLRAARLVRGVPGRLGGYRLARPAAQISVAEILEAVVGPICIVKCLEDSDGCPRTADCEGHPLFALLNHAIREKLRSCTLRDLLDPVRVESMRSDLERLDSKQAG